MSKYFYLIIFLICATALMLRAQTQDSYEYQSEITWGINKNTSGGLIGGFFFKKGRKLSEDVLETYGLEIVNIKHPQEVRVSSEQGNLFIFGKSNYLYAFRFQYGRDKILFKKAPQQGVEIKAVFAVGPTLGVVIPYYVQLQDDALGNKVYQRYDPSVNSSSILGSGPPFYGLGRAGSQVKLGGNFKAALNFELGTVKSQVTGFEVGFLLDAYTSKIEIVSDAKKYALYPTLFIAIFYGSRK